VAVRGRQLRLRFRSRGGARRGAGRPPKGERAGVSHGRRARLSRQHPVHVTLKARSGLPSLRLPALFAAVRRALAAGKQRFGFSLVHFSVQRDHLHLIAEAEDRRALARGMQGLTIRLARAVNRQACSKGAVFLDRYHDRVLKTPRAVRCALRYVLLNGRKHERAAVPCGFVDECSSAPWFAGFQRPAELVFGASGVRSEWLRQGEERVPVIQARTWLLCAGYLRAGPFDVDEVPSG
jgi:REP element-mobilizing transposase RayT